MGRSGGPDDPDNFSGPLGLSAAAVDAGAASRPGVAEHRGDAGQRQVRPRGPLSQRRPAKWGPAQNCSGPGQYNTYAQG